MTAMAAARLGYAFDRWLVYAKGGAAWTREKWNVNDGVGGAITGNFDRTGWIVGAGVEWAMFGNWSAKVEYNYLNFGGSPVGSYVLRNSSGYPNVAGVMDWSINWDVSENNGTFGSSLHSYLSGLPAAH